MCGVGREGSRTGPPFSGPLAKIRARRWAGTGSTTLRPRISGSPIASPTALSPTRLFPSLRLVTAVELTQSETREQKEKKNTSKRKTELSLWLCFDRISTSKCSLLLMFISWQWPSSFEPIVLIIWQYNIKEPHSFLSYTEIIEVDFFFFLFSLQCLLLLLW